MSRRRRALAFLVLALLAAAAAAVIADGYGANAARGYGPLRPAVVTVRAIDAGERLDPARVGADLTLRRIPERFAPPDALLAPGEALGLVTRATLPAGSYVLGAQLGVSGEGKPKRHHLGGDRRPVTISVSGAEALLAARSPGSGSRVDVVVTSEPTGAGRGRTYVAAAAVPLLALRPGDEGPVGPTAAATLGLTRRQALRLIAAESFARQLTLLPTR